MSRFVHEGYTKVAFVPTVADISEPTVAELGAGTELTELMPKDGLGINFSQNMVDNASLADTFDAQLVGSWGGSITLTGFRDNVDADDDFWNLASHGTNGFLVVRRGIADSTAWTAAQTVEVYPVQLHQPFVGSTAANEQVRFTLAAAVTSEPNLSATVAA
jgi:hypothetical protein